MIVKKRGMTKKIKKTAAKGSASHENFGSKYLKIFVIIKLNKFYSIRADATVTHQPLRS